MPRIARTLSESGFYHVMVRGHDQGQLFYDDADREAFLDRLERYAGLCAVSVLAWCLMGNHVHLLVRDEKHNLSSAMHRLLTSYARYFNNRYDHVGYLYQDRFKSKPIETETYLLTVLRYILRNPLEVGENPEKLSSFRQTMDMSGFVDSRHVLSLFDDDLRVAKGLFESFVLSPRGGDRSTDATIALLRPDRQRGASDNRVIEVLTESAGVANCRDIACLSPAARSVVVKKAMSEGATVRQVSRLTGLGKTTVHRACR